MAFFLDTRTVVAQTVSSLGPANVGLTANLQLAVEHREPTRHDVLERTFVESRRRVKVIGRLPGESTCLALVWAVLDRVSVGWRGIDTSVGGVRQLQDLRRQLLGPALLRAPG